MAEESSKHYGRLQRFILLVFLVGWIAVVAVLAFFMRAWIPDTNLAAELDAIELADTEEIDLERPLPATLQPQSDLPSAFSVSGRLYIPLYDSLYVGGSRDIKNLSATLSLRNTSVDQEIVVTALTYFDKTGTPIRELLNGPHVLAPMSTAELYIDQSAAGETPVTAVVVAWGATASSPPPLAEAVILGTYGAKSISFVSHGTNRQ